MSALPKSLHTVTVVRRVAALLLKERPECEDMTAAELAITVLDEVLELPEPDTGNDTLRRCVEACAAVLDDLREATEEAERNGPRYPRIVVEVAP
jgi:hypothetical protein